MIFKKTMTIGDIKVEYAVDSESVGDAWDIIELLTEDLSSKEYDISPPKIILQNATANHLGAITFYDNNGDIIRSEKDARDPAGVREIIRRLKDGSLGV